MWYSTTQLAKREGVTTQTIRRRILDGTYREVKMTAGGHFRIKINEERRTICYARVSSSKQRSSIDTQIARLRIKYPEAEYISDIASAFNFKRQGIETVLECAFNGTPIHLVATTQDRIARSGFDLIKRIVELSGGTIELLDESPETDDFNTADLIGFITSFCNSHYGKRSAARRANKNSSDQEDPGVPGE